jgi:DNA invertase Pin-like site-specific DNA recombinase
MSTLAPLTTRTQSADEEIRRDVIEIRQVLPELGYRLERIYKEARNGLIFCAAYELPGVSSDRAQAIGYLRVSMYMQSDGYSLATQARQIIALATERGQVVSRIYVDAGISGADSKRPAFQAMMRHVTHKAERRYRAAYCYDLYRFYRGLIGLANNYQLLYDHGVELGSVAEKHTDLGKSDGKMLIYLKGIMGEMYLDDLSRTVRDNKLSRVLKGYSNASLPPFGYCRGNCFQCTDNNGAGYCPRFGSRDDLWRELSDDPKVFVPHPVEQHGFRIASGLHSAGRHSDADITRRLNPPWDPDQLARLVLAPRVTIQEIDGGMLVVQLQDGTHALQRPDGELLFFRPKGRAGRPDPDRRFTRDTIRDMLQNPYYAGFVVYRRQKRKGRKRVQVHKRFKTPLSEMNRRQRDDARLEGDHAMLFPGQHLPLITLDQYEQSQRVRGMKGCNPSSARRTRRIYPLSGILKCARCEEPFRGNAGNGDVRYYEDAGRAKGISDCPMRSFRAEGIEGEVFACVEKLHIPEEWHVCMPIYLREGPKWDELRRERRAVQTRLSAAREMLKQEIISLGEFRELERECRRRLQKLERDGRYASVRQERLLRDFPRVWAAATNEERKGILRCIFSAIWIKDGEIVAYEPRGPFAALLPIRVSALVVGDVSGQVEELTDALTQLPAS